MKSGIMKSGKVLIAVLCSALLMFAFALAGCGKATTTITTGNTTTYSPAEGSQSYTFTTLTPGTLTIGSDCDYPPFTYLDETTQKPTGFEAELMAAICDEMGITCTYADPVKFDTIVTTVASNSKFDVGVSAFTINDERKEEIDFTDPYFDSNQAVVVLADSSYTDAASLAGKIIGVQSGTTGESWANENISGATVKSLDDVTSVLNALVAGQVDGAVFDLPVAIEQIKGSFSQCKIIEQVPTGEQYGIVVSKDNPQLTAALNAALAAVRANGTYDTIYNKYFSY